MKKTTALVIVCSFLIACVTSQKKSEYSNWLSPQNKCSLNTKYFLDNIEGVVLKGSEYINAYETKKRSWYEVWKKKAHRTGKILAVYGREVYVAADGCNGYLILDSGNRIVLKCTTSVNGKKSCRVLQKDGDKYYWVDTYYKTLSFSQVGASISGSDCNDPLAQGEIKFNPPSGSTSCSWGRSMSIAGLMLSIQGGLGKEYKVLLKSKEYKYWNFDEDSWQENK